jgi:hypothetical protein
MLISTLDKIDQLPQPALGLLGAVHTATVTNLSGVLVNGDFPPASSTKGQVFLNNVTTPLSIPAGGNYPARALNQGDHVASNGTLYYKVVNKRSITRQITSVSNGVFTTAMDSPLLEDGLVVTPEGFSSPQGFSNGTEYAISYSGENTFSLRGQGAAILPASASIAGWIHSKKTNSFYPAAFERTAYSVSFTPQSLAIGSSFTLTKAFTFRAIGASTAAVYSVIFEFGVRRNTTSPAPVGSNIAGYDFLPPALEQEVVLTDVTSRHTLGIQFVKTPSGMNGQRLIYSKSLALIPGTYPVDTEDFILRIRIGQFDIQEDTDTQGYVGYLIQDPS